MKLLIRSADKQINAFAFQGLPKSSGLALDVLRIEDQFGSAGLWTAREEGGNIWLTRDRGSALIQNGVYVQIVKTIDGRMCLRLPSD